MDSEGFSSSRDMVKCFDCGCSCSLTGGSSSGTWIRSVKRKYDDFENNNYRLRIPGFDSLSVARVEVENECVALREMVSNQQQVIQDLYTELDEERNASSSAANEAMSMMLRLQREKAEVQMEARQFKRFAEEKVAHDQYELSALEELLYKREQTIQSLTSDIHAYKQRMINYGLTEDEADVERSGRTHDLSMVVSDSHREVPMYEYPPLRCNVNETPGTLEDDNDYADIEKYAFGETPLDRDCLKIFESRVSFSERSPRSNQFDGNFSASKKVLEKVIVGQSPRKSRHSRKFSTDSSSAMVKETAPDFDPPRFTSFKKEYVSQSEDYSNFNNLSEVGDYMNDRVYTIDSVHNGNPYNGSSPYKTGVGIFEDDMATPRGSMTRVDLGDPDIKKLYMRLQALEADRESMRQAIISMRTDKAQLVLLKEIAQHLCKEMSPERRVIAKKPSLIRRLSVSATFKWIMSFMSWKRKACRSKYLAGLSNSAGLLMLLDKGSDIRPWRCLTSAEI